MPLRRNMSLGIGISGRVECNLSCFTSSRFNSFRCFNAPIGYSILCSVSRSRNHHNADLLADMKISETAIAPAAVIIGQSISLNHMQTACAQYALTVGSFTVSPPRMVLVKIDSDFQEHAEIARTKKRGDKEDGQMTGLGGTEVSVVDLHPVP
ncbi:hypothetical protein D9757_013375 [Collybiopsis confluens]|uniref:Uncharacterized protein n=1 Tax=Collybiopsis confluens TaxID=2823264 RepID=A0A8H5LMY3_9AGAR|nr:hypothetical protein D9757_013375 [Collybiopsis confluens]